MTKQELFKKYSIDETHDNWEQIDSWMSIEVYRLMHNGQLPPNNDNSILWLLKFLDKAKDLKWWYENIMIRKDWGSLYVTSKRMVYRFSEQILNDLGKEEKI